MGFSVSGSAVVLFLGIFISFGVAYTAANNGFERVGDAYEQQTDEELFRQNTAISIDRTGFVNDSEGRRYVNVTVDNTGATALSVTDTDILVGGDYTTHTSNRMATLEVNGNNETDLWLPGETLHFEVNVTDRPGSVHVKVVTESGVADAEVV